MQSYAENEFHLMGDYSDNVVAEILYEDKLEFLKTKIEEQIGGKYFVSNSVMKKLIDELDNDVDEYLDDIDYYGDNENDD